MCISLYDLSTMLDQGLGHVKLCSMNAYEV